MSGGAAALSESWGRVETAQLQGDRAAPVERQGRHSPIPETALDFVERTQQEVPIDAPAKKRLWWITIQGWEHADDIEAWFEAQKPLVSRMVACRDVAPRTGKEHLHIAIALKMPKSWHWVRQTFFADYAKWVKAGMDWQRVMTYALGKTGNPEHDENKRVFIEHNAQITKTIKQGTTAEFFREWKAKPDSSNLIRLLDKDEYSGCIPQIDACKRYIQLINSTKHTRPKERIVVWLYGDTRRGKSYFCHQFMEAFQNRFGRPCRTVAFSNTCAQVSGLMGDEAVVLIDDIKLDTVKIQDLLNMTDQYPLTLDTKGSYCYYNPDVVLITCITDPDQIQYTYQRWRNDYEQLVKRITHKIKVWPRERQEKNYEIGMETYTCAELVDFLLDSLQ